MNSIQFLVNDIDGKEEFATGFENIKTYFVNVSNSLFGKGKNPQGKYKKIIDNLSILMFQFLGPQCLLGGL